MSRIERAGRRLERMDAQLAQMQPADRQAFMNEVFRLSQETTPQQRARARRRKMLRSWALLLAVAALCFAVTYGLLTAAHLLGWLR